MANSLIAVPIIKKIGRKENNMIIILSFKDNLFI
jgi:hypothetical protein